MMQTEKNPSNKKTNAKTSTKTKKVEEESVLKKQGIKVQFEDLKKQVEKFKTVADNTKDDAEITTTNTQTSIFFDKNKALGIENEPKNETGGINMAQNKDTSTSNEESSDDKSVNVESSADKEVKLLHLEDNSDGGITVKNESVIQDANADNHVTDDSNVTSAEIKKLHLEDNSDGGITVKDESVIQSANADNHVTDDSNVTSADVKELRLEDNSDSGTTVEEEPNQVINADNNVTSAEVKLLHLEDNSDGGITVKAETNQLKNADSNVISESQANNNNSNQVNDTQMADTTEDKTLAEKKTDDTPKEKTHEEKVKELKDKTDLKSEETTLINKETEQINSIEAQKKAKREAIKNLFESTGGNIPAMFNEVNKELIDLMKTDKVLGLGTINFSDDLKSFRTPTFANSYNLDSATDFFGMQIDDQELLFDRIGLFKGIVIDYSKENAIEQGYRDVVKHLIKENDDTRSKPVRVFYKKPRLSGFYETNYAFDEQQKKSQESGVFNLGFGLSASYNSGFVSAGVKAGYSYSKESLSEKTSHIKEISIISSFFLPKIELSFDTLQSCAADDLIVYLERALENEQDTVACFDRVNTILMSYGQFVPTSLVIGARLYSSDTKKITQDETVENVLTKHAASFKAAVSTMVFEGGIEAEMKSDNSSKSNEKNTSEAQNIQFNAIGGEGAFVANMDKWVASTADSKGWGLVRFDNLVPVIDVLPDDLQQRITNLFDRVVEECTIEDLLSKGAQFLFHKGYFERFGRYAQPKFCVIKHSLGTKQVLTVKINGELENYQEVSMSAYDGIGGDIQEWYYANSGKIYLKHNYDTNNKFVLSINTSIQPTKLVITQDDYFDNQLWDARGGMIQCTNNNNYITYDGSQIKLEPQKDIAKNNTWLLVDEKEMNTPSRRRIEPVRKNTLMLLDAVSDTLDNNYYLPLEGTLKSQNGYAQLKFSADKIAILWGKSKKEIWSQSITNEGAFKLGITNGTLAVLNEKEEILEEIATDIVDIRLMDSGNFEAIDQASNIVWETNSIVYAYIRNEITKVALSVMVQMPNIGRPEFKHINSQPYAGGDHQLWYINRNNNIVSKYTENKQKFALTEIITDNYNPYGGVPSKNFHVQLEMLNTAYAKSQQWGGLVPNKKGSIQNQVSKEILVKGVFTVIANPNEKWELIFDENARQQSNMPYVSHSYYADEKELKYHLHQYYHSLAFTNIIIKGHDIQAVRMNGEYWDEERNSYHLKLQFRTSTGVILESNKLEEGRFYSHGFGVPDLLGAAYFSHETTSLSLGMYATTDEQGTRVAYFQFEIDNIARAVGQTLFVNASLYEDNTKLNSICSNWVERASNHSKTIGVGFVKVSETAISPCLISIY